MPQPPVGIDLGTTYSVIAYVDETGRPLTISNEAGDLLTPSAVSLDDGEIIVGKEAVKQAVFDPDVFADGFKRDIGRSRFRRPIARRQVPPEVLSAFVLRRLKQDAERRLGTIENVVITVPAFFDETRRRATQEAGRIAGLNVIDIINEPTAAAVAFGYLSSTRKEQILVYDLGGGTFDVTVLQIDGNTFRTLATDGDVQLGGRDFDERLVNHVAEKFIAAHGSDPRRDPHDVAQLWQNAQDAKHTLSTRASVSIPCFHQGIKMRVDLTRGEFENLTADLLDRTATTTQLVLRQARLTWDQIDRILLVGGASRMPMIAAMLEQAAGKLPDRSLSPDEAVAHGAALYAARLSPESVNLPSEFELINVNSHSLGIIGLDQREKRHRNIVIIPKNTPLPCKVVRGFATARDNQSSVRVVVVEGESERPEHCIELGMCVVRNLPPGLPKGTKIEVEYSYATNGRISVRARVPQARQSAAVDLQYDAALNLNLTDWQSRICGDEPAATDGAEDTIPRFAKYLDELLVSFGKKVARLGVPKKLADHRAVADEAAQELERLSAEYVQAEREQQAAARQTEILHAASSMSQITLALEVAEMKARTAHRTLAIGCIEHGFVPPELEMLHDEIRHFQTA